MKALNYILGYTLGLLLLMACASLPTDAGRTLYVQNDGLEVVRVYTPYGAVGSAMPGEKRCFRLPEFEGQIHLYLRSGSEEEETPFLDSSSPHWQIKVGTSPLRYSAITLVPGGDCASSNFSP